MYSYFQLEKLFKLNYFCEGSTNKYLHKNLTREYFHTQKFADLW